MTFGQWVRDQRESRRMTKTECAQRAGISVQRWAQIEADESSSKAGGIPQPSRKTAERVALAFGIPLSAALEAAGYQPDLPSALFLPDDGRPTVALGKDNIAHLPSAQELDAAMSVFQRALAAIEEAKKQKEEQEGNENTDDE